MDSQNQINNIGRLLRVINSLKEDGALEREDWLLLLPLMITLVKQLREELKHKPLLMIGLSGVQHILQETLETIQDSEGI